MNNSNREPLSTAASSDPLIDEVRAIRKALGDRFDNDVEKLAEHACQIGEQFRREIISRAGHQSSR